VNSWLDFNGKAALVTGSSRGIGAAIVRALGRHGAKCVVNYVADPAGRNEADARAVAADLHDPLLIECDVGDDAQVEAMMQRIAAERGGLDILVNNAGIMRDRSLKKITTEDWDAVIRVNLTGAFNCIHHAQATLRPGGRIVNIASAAGHYGFFGQANYAASKAGIVGLTRVVARELARQQITVNAISPGFIETDMMSGVPADAVAKLVEQVPLGRMGNVEDVANAALFLASPHAAYITGQVVHVNGGFLMG
jgi:3-oxoacyl-[acyl-carrier protein] reductase